ncbi:hypothetical protein [Dyadobacter crusticola]|uniref:hypothetical protein n=1 Tax=Dyadobacter crusticola TaxID=292407 RepID=UPI0004E1A679|nr:hypothetical protein [Dyadobacter crusticola]
MDKIIKTSKIEDLPGYDKEYWWSKTPEERLEAALKLMRSAKEIYYANPKNKPLGYGTRILKSDQPIKRGKG